LESIAETQPKLQPALLRLSAIISQYFTKVRDFCLLWLLRTNPKRDFARRLCWCPARFWRWTAKNDASLT